MSAQTQKVDVARYMSDVNAVLKAVGTFTDLKEIKVNDRLVADKISDLLGDSYDVVLVLAGVIRAADEVIRCFTALGEGDLGIFHRPSQITACEKAMVALHESVARIGSAP